VPTATAIGTHVRVTAEVIDPKTQTTVYSESADGEGADSLLASVDTVNRQLRLRLGEAMASVSAESQPLAEVATKDLDALRAYSLGLQAYGQSRQADARDLFQQAVTLDPEFALAYIGIARTYYSNNDLVTAKRYMDKAATFKDHLAPRDRLYLDAWLAGFGPSGPLLAKWKLLSQLYPDYYAASYNYAYFAWLFENRAADAIAAIKPALSEHNPLRGSAYYTLGYLQAAENEFDTAIKNFDVAVALGDDPPGNFRAAAYAAQRRFPEADHVLSQAKPSGIATEDVLFPREAMVQQLDQGHWGRVRTAIAESLATASQVGPSYERAYRAMALSVEAYAPPSAERVRALRDFIAGARKASEQPQAADHQDTVFANVFGAYLAARSGQLALAQTTLAATAPQSLNSGYTNLEHLQAIAAAEVEWRLGRADDAIQHLEPTVDGSELYLTHVALADAYTAAGRREDAFKQAQWLDAHRGRAYLEINSEQILQALNVAESDLALLRMAELAHASGRDDEADKMLSAFDAVWPRTDQPPSAVARSDALDRALHSRGS
jgi:putative peptide modification system cyclase